MPMVTYQESGRSEIRAQEVWFQKSILANIRKSLLVVLGTYMGFRE